VVVVSLVEEDVLAVLDALGVGVVFLKDPGGADAVLLAELLPKLCSDCVKEGLLWLPH
jgi:hypothetical protein